MQFVLLSRGKHPLANSCMYLCLPWQEKNLGVENGKLPSPSGSHPSGSHQSPPGTPALSGQSETYQTFSFSDKEGETDDNEQIQLIESEQGFGNGRVTVTEETSKISDPDLQSKAENVYFHHSVGRPSLS